MVYASSDIKYDRETVAAKPFRSFGMRVFRH
jgi:hypothetical protein